MCFDVEHPLSIVAPQSQLFTAVFILECISCCGSHKQVLSGNIKILQRKKFWSVPVNRAFISTTALVPEQFIWMNSLWTWKSELHTGRETNLNDEYFDGTRSNGD